MPTQCPQGIPQAACDAATAVIASQGGVPQNWGGSDVAQTLQQWYAAISKSNPSLPQALPPTVAEYTLPPFATLLPAATAYWNGVAYKNPGISGNINPQAWSFPWQYASPQSTNWYQAAVSALGSMVNDPNAKQVLLGGKLPPFDPTKINWPQFGASPIADNPAVFAQTANDIAKIDPVMQAFLAKANACGLLQKTSAEVQQALATFLATGQDPCGSQQPVPGPLPLPPVPTPTPAPTPTTTTAQAQSNTGLLVVGAAAAVAVGALLYMLAKRPASS